MLVSKECFERGCSCYDDRVDKDPVEVAKRQWVGLTDDEIHQAFCYVEYETPNDWNTDPERWCQQFARYLEQRLKERNHEDR